MEYDDESAMICPRTGTYCVRAFCEDYGCANEAGVPIDANDIAAGSEDINETIPRIPKPKRRRRRK